MVYPHRNLLLKISLGIIPLVQKNATKWLFLKFTDSGSSNIGPLDQQLEPFDCTSIPSHLSRWIQESVPIYANTAQNPKKETRTQINHKWYSMWYAYIEKKYLILFYSSKKCSMYVYNWMYIYIWDSTSQKNFNHDYVLFIFPLVYYFKQSQNMFFKVFWAICMAHLFSKNPSLLGTKRRWCSSAGRSTCAKRGPLKTSEHAAPAQTCWAAGILLGPGEKISSLVTGGEKMETLPYNKPLQKTTHSWR